jgi:hypothetical protein
VTAFSLRISVLFAATLGGVAGCEEKTPAKPGRPSSSTQDVTQRPAKARTTLNHASPRLPTARITAEGSKTAERVYRPDDDRPRHDDAALERAGIHRYESKRLVLYTDIDRDKAVRLPPLVDALYGELTSYFGPLPPQRDGGDWQITGYVMRDMKLFEAAGVVPSNLPTFEHGLNRRRRFWMREQSLDHYLEHLLLHEATHCFMTTLPVPRAPTWYMEGMAEHFAAHRRTPDGGVQFRILPQTPDETAGFDRITLIRKEVDAGRAESLDEVFAIPDDKYIESIPYAWAWALCHFLDAQPEYHERFKELGDPHLGKRFRDEFDARFANENATLRLQWQLFAHALCYGYQLDRAVLDFEKGRGTPDHDSEVHVRADRGWQATGLRLEANAKYNVTSTGEFSLCETPKPWPSDANGITLDYANGRPLGRLLAAVLPDDLASPNAAASFLEPIDVGSRGTVSSPVGGTLYLRLNDGWDRLSDNRGEIAVHVKPIDD